MLILRIHKLIYLLLVLTLTSCEKEDENSIGETIPAYIQIDAISIDDVNDTEKITDAWVYINDQLQGVYELPSLFPVLSTGKQNIRIKGGIKNNGISSSRRAYPFYKSFIQEKNLKADQITSMYPIVSYIDSTNIIGNSTLNLEMFFLSSMKQLSVIASYL